MRYYNLPLIFLPLTLLGCQAIRDGINYQPKDEAERIAIRKFADECRDKQINRAYDWMQEERLR